MSLIRFPLALPPVAKKRRDQWIRALLGFLTLLIVLASLVLAAAGWEN